VPKTVNAVFNSSFDVWQRGTSFTGVSPYYGPDRWFTVRVGGVAGSTYSRQSSGLTGFNYALRAQRDSGNNATNALQVGQSLETADSLRFAGKTVTFSFWARKGADYSGASSQLNYRINTGTGTDQQYWNTGYTGSATALSENATLTTSWQRFSASGTVSSSATEIAFGFAFSPVGTAGANDWFEITGVQLEEGSVATNYQRMSGTLQGEIDLCKRYYQFLERDNVTFIGHSYNSTEVWTAVYFEKAMRVAPTVLLGTAGTSANRMSFLKADGTAATTVGTHTVGFERTTGFRLYGSGYAGLTSASISPLWANGLVTIYTASAEL
jgi:hypothetical protein